MDVGTDTQAIVTEVRIEAPPETVFRFFTEPDLMSKWFGSSAELDARPGGPHRIQLNPVAIARGEYVEVDPPRRVVMTFGWEGDGHPVPPGSSTLEVTLTPDGDGTLLRLVPSGLPEEQRADHKQGWDMYAGRLATAATGGDPGPDPNAQAASAS
jgi:uncharacterized protein YndB with AHSA1/START domain